MKKNSILYLAFVLFAAIFSACESTTNPPITIAKFTDSTLFVLSEGGYGKNNAELDGFSLKTDTVKKDIIDPLGDIGNDIQIFGKRIYVVLEHSDKIISINPDSIADRISIQFPAGATPYNMAQVSSSEVWVSEFSSKEIGILNINTNSLTSKIPIDTSLSFIKVYNGKAYLLTNANNLEVIDIATKNVLFNKYIGEYPAEIVIDSLHNSIVALTYGDAYVAKTLPKIFWVDANTYAYTDSITVSAADEINQVIPAGDKVFLTFGDRLDVLDLSSHKVSAFIHTSYYKGIFDVSTNELIVGRGSFTAPGNVDILDASTGTVKYTFSSGILPGHFIIYRKQ